MSFSTINSNVNKTTGDSNNNTTENSSTADLLGMDLLQSGPRLMNTMQPNNSSDMLHINNKTNNVQQPAGNTNISSANAGAKAPANEFVRKLFRILENNEYPDIVTWTENGKSFVVLDTGKFTTHILPNHFKHSNFASFVRQLNKYDFHKVKRSPEERQRCKYGEQSWEFQHPEFRVHYGKGLDNIKRKIPAQRKVLLDESQKALLHFNSEGTNPNNPSGSLLNESTTELLLSNTVSKDAFGNLRRRVDKLQKELDMSKMESYATKVELQKLNSKYNTVIESLITFKTINENLLNNFNTLCSTLANNGIEVPIFGDNGNRNPTGNTNPATTTAIQSNNNTNNASPATSTVSLQLPNLPDQNSLTPNAQNNTVTLRKGFHVLLVEDDAVSIQLCSKFLRKYGCTVQVVSDGLSAISTLEKYRYDLVLMDIVMPNLDGATATSIVRSFDNETPIIAMTGNIMNQDLITYLQHGMNDILAKPFTRDDLHSILIRYLKDRIPLCEQQLPPRNPSPQTHSNTNTANSNPNTINEQSLAMLPQDNPSTTTPVTPGASISSAQHVQQGQQEQQHQIFHAQQQQQHHNAIANARSDVAIPNLEHEINTVPHSSMGSTPQLPQSTLQENQLS
ncbi:ASB_HP2_G0025780.mRNA.1.CDS.1 [Saccharomyces cerevisiae]|nr:ASB_HP2_G0025780.mRNA.1.CDS.1 [Saccharomyces cerevisiae]CAI6573016.1 ASB_HP1_G0025300.mRNA.1.CDS.1 [Saccharomyces cerevisiae]CAI6575316.1 ASB_HP2_G0025780.mRNA.1.CDS.1 [Saccharomyces cerevisiae]CAI7167977.1 ASB_collapsed_G0026130.mRNA.1.CDS.1 [Saccharomyces cerevisiae]